MGVQLLPKGGRFIGDEPHTPQKQTSDQHLQQDDSCPGQPEPRSTTTAFPHHHRTEMKHQTRSGQPSNSEAWAAEPTAEPLLNLHRPWAAGARRAAPRMQLSERSLTLQHEEQHCSSSELLGRRAFLESSAFSEALNHNSCCIRHLEVTFGRTAALC